MGDVNIDVQQPATAWAQEPQFIKIMCPDFYIKTHKVFWHFSPDMVLNFCSCALPYIFLYIYFFCQCDALKVSHWVCGMCLFLLHMEEMLFYEDKHWVQICFGGKNSCWVGLGFGSTMLAFSYSASTPRHFITCCYLCHVSPLRDRLSCRSNMTI